MEKLEYDPKNVLIVPIAGIVNSDYNPKDEDPRDFEHVKRSVELNGMMQPVFVRTEKGSKEYILVDGHQRTRAMKELGYKDVPIYNLGDISEKRAKALTLWFQDAKTQTNEVSLAGLVSQLDGLEMEMPYSEARIEELKAMAEFDFNYGDEEPDDSDLDDGLRTLNIKLTPAQFDIVNEAIQLLVENDNISEGRALELLCASGVQGYPFDGVDNFSEK